MSHSLISEFPSEKDVIALAHSQRHLPWFVPYATIRAASLLKRGTFDVVHIGDLLLAPLGALLKRAFGVPVAVTAHGLDITWKAPLYQTIIPRCARCLDKVICISEYTLEQCVARGIAPERCVVIPCGIDARQYETVRERKTARMRLSRAIDRDLSDRKILTTVGRLVLRKGHRWFLRNVYPKLPEETVYLIAGDGPEKGSIERTVSEQGFGDRVILLGGVTEELKRDLLAAADVFVMPNVRVDGDVEGFGIVASEAAASGAAVVASRIDGIPSAVIHKSNGFLVDAEDAQAMFLAIDGLLRDWEHAAIFQRQAREYTLEHYDWPAIRERYLREFMGLTHQGDLKGNSRAALARQSGIGRHQNWESGSE